MHNTETPSTKPHTKTTRMECCADHQCESGLRNKYYQGKRLTPEMFRVEQRYLVERRRLLNRAIHGWGVVYGYKVNVSKTDSSSRLEIDSGLALDEYGRELLQVGALSLKLDHVIVLDEKGSIVEVKDRQNFFAGQQADADSSCWLLSAHYAERVVGPVQINDPCSCERDEWDQVCETVRYSLHKIDCSKCCNEFLCELTCECGTEPCCEENIAIMQGKGTTLESQKQPPFKRGGCRCLCEHLTELPPGADCSECLHEVEEPCGLVGVDLQHGVPLACVKLEKDKCDHWTFHNRIEACGPRRLVKRNDLLFDLIRGCDLTRISEIGWSDWHRKYEDKDAVPFDTFAKALGYQESLGKPPVEYVSEWFRVKFSRAVRKETLLTDCFVMTILSRDKREGWCNTLRVPLARVDYGGDTGEYVTTVKLVFEGKWVRDVAAGGWSEFLDRPTQVEIEIRGDFIIDCNGQPVDANAVGLTPHPTGNGSPGGTFVSTFRVQPSGR